MPHARLFLAACLGAVIALRPSVAEAEESSEHPALPYNLRLELPLLVGGYVTWSTLQALNFQLAPKRCRWCDEDLNAVDEKARTWLRWSKHRTLALTLSDLGANTVAPAVTVGLSAILAANDERFASVPVDLVVTGEAVVLSGVVTQIVKYSVGRMRPDARALPAAERPNTGHGNDAYVSFWSGHTSYAFSLASAAGTVAWLRRYPGYPWVWVAGFSVATATAYFRVASDKHYLTDVLSAGATASLIGFATPFFFHHPLRFGVSITPSVYPVAGGAVLALDLF